jgi:hypothetical protein
MAHICMVLTCSLSSFKLYVGTYILEDKDSEGPEKTTRGGGGVNESQSKFFYKNWHTSKVQTPKSTSYKKVMNTSTNNIEMIPSKL